jgi:electron transfer flavoprotein beta subunit
MRRLVVPIKQVATLDDDFDLEPGATTVDPDYLEFDLNEWDSFSLEAALQIREQLPEGDTEVVVITVGDENADDAVLACLAKGADRAVRIWDAELSDLDALAIAAVLAAALRKEQPDLVLCGVQSSDHASSATGTALAGLLDLPHAAVIKALEYKPAEQVVILERELEGGLVEQLSLPTPALITVQTGANEPRYANLRAIKQAEAKPFARLTLSDLDLDAAAVTERRAARTVALTHPPAGDRQATILEGDAAAVADQILELIAGFLADQGGVIA